MFSNISITRECRKNLINLKGRRYNEVTDLSEDELARYLKIDNDVAIFKTPLILHFLPCAHRTWRKERKNIDNVN